MSLEEQVNSELVKCFVCGEMERAEEMGLCLICGEHSHDNKRECAGQCACAFVNLLMSVAIA